MAFRYGVRLAAAIHDAEFMLNGIGAITVALDTGWLVLIWLLVDWNLPEQQTQARAVEFLDHASWIRPLARDKVKVFVAWRCAARNRRIVRAVKNVKGSFIAPRLNDQNRRGEIALDK